MGKTLSQHKRPGIEQQRQAILEAAVALFSVTGAAAVSVSAISKQAGVSRDTFYRCYDNKDQLVDALYERSVSNKMLALTAAQDTDFADPVWLRRAIDGMVDDILAEHQAARFLFLEAADPSSHAHQVIDGALNQVSADMQRWCKSHYGSAPSRDCFMGLLSAAQWLVQRAITNGMGKRDIRAAKTAIEELFAATFLGLNPET